MAKDLKEYTLEELQKVAKYYSISGYESMTKDELVTRLNAFLYPDKIKEGSLKAGESKTKLSNRKLKNDSGIYVHKLSWKYFMPRIVLSMLLIFELITFVQPIIAHSLFDGGYRALTLNESSNWISWAVSGRDWGIAMTMNGLSLLYTVFIFYSLIKNNSFNYMIYVSVLLVAGYFYYRVFNVFSDMQHAQSFLNSNKNNPSLQYDSKFTGLLAFYWSILGVSSFFLVVPSFIVLINLITKTFSL